jgi:chromosome segregation ATPase
MTTDAKQPSLRRDLGDVTALPDEVAHLVPAEVRETSAAFGARRQQLEDAQAALRKARRDLTDTRRTDQTAAVAALEAGKATPKPKLAAAEAKVSEHQRAVAAAREAALRAEDAYIASLLSNHGEITQAASNEQAKTAASAAAAIDQLEAALVDGSAVRRLLHALGPDPDGLRGRTRLFAPKRRGKAAARHPLAGTDYAEKLAALREAVEA